LRLAQEFGPMQMAIITSYLPDAAYGLLGPQMAATIIQDHTRLPCIVIAVTRDDDKDCLKKALSDYFGSLRPVIGFSALSGREDFFPLARCCSRSAVRTQPG
jgi:hypothetical protein